MFIMFCIACGAFGIFLGIIISNSLTPKCKHNWKLIKSGDIVKRDFYGDETVRGWIKVYECSHCKKMKTNKVTLYD